MAVKLVRSRSRVDGKGVPCGDGYMSEGETCHVGKGGGGTGKGGGNKLAEGVSKVMEALPGVGSMGEALAPQKEPGFAKKLAAEIVAQTTNDILYESVGLPASVLTGNPLPLLASTVARYTKPGHETGKAIRSQLEKRIGSRGFDSKRARLAVNLGGKAVLGGLVMAAFAQSNKPSREYDEELARNAELKKRQSSLADMIQQQTPGMSRKRAEGYARNTTYIFWQTERAYQEESKGKADQSKQRRGGNT